MRDSAVQAPQLKGWRHVRCRAASARIGVERSTLGVVFVTHVAAVGLRGEAERAPVLGFFFRSDHFAFARACVPALFLDHGTDFRDRPDD